MSAEQKNTIAFIANNFLKVVLGLCGGLLTLLYVQMKSEQSEDRAEFKIELRQVKAELREQGKDINQIRVDVATIKREQK